jgi:hypothetical protein
LGLTESRDLLREKFAETGDGSVVTVVNNHTVESFVELLETLKGRISAVPGFSQIAVLKDQATAPSRVDVAAPNSTLN